MMLNEKQSIVFFSCAFVSFVVVAFRVIRHLQSTLYLNQHSM